VTRASGSTSTPAGFGSSSTAQQQVDRQRPSTDASAAQPAHPALGSLRQRRAEGPATSARQPGLSAPRSSNLPGAARGGQVDALQQPLLRHLAADQIRDAQRILRREGPSAYPRLTAEAQAAGSFPLSQYVNERGESTDFAKRIKRDAREERVRDHAIRAGAASTLLATAGLAVVVSPLGHAFRRAGERLDSRPPRVFSDTPQAYQPPPEEDLPPYPGEPGPR